MATASAAEPDADERQNDDDDVPEPCKDADDGDPDVGPRDPDIDGRPNIGRRDPDPDEPLALASLKGDGVRKLDAVLEAVKLKVRARQLDWKIHKAFFKSDLVLNSKL